MPQSGEKGLGTRARAFDLPNPRYRGGAAADVAAIVSRRTPRGLRESRPLSGLLLQLSPSDTQSRFLDPQIQLAEQNHSLIVSKKNSTLRPRRTGAAGRVLSTLPCLLSSHKRCRWPHTSRKKQHAEEGILRENSEGALISVIIYRSLIKTID